MRRRRQAGGRQICAAAVAHLSESPRCAWWHCPLAPRGFEGLGGAKLQVFLLTRAGGRQCCTLAPRQMRVRARAGWRRGRGGRGGGGSTSPRAEWPSSAPSLCTLWAGARPLSMAIGVAGQEGEGERKGAARVSGWASTKTQFPGRGLHSMLCDPALPYPALRSPAGTLACASLTCAHATMSSMAGLASCRHTENKARSGGGGMHACWLPQRARPPAQRSIHAGVQRHAHPFPAKAARPPTLAQGQSSKLIIET